MDRTTPKVSVIVATYNQEEYIARTLDSIVAQKCDFPFEIILSDDCSSDNTPVICQQYADKHPGIIRYIHNATNKGLVDNYYDAVRAAQGKYIADCGGDDVWCDPLKLQKEADVLDAHPNVSLVHTNWKYLHEKTGDLTSFDPQQTREYWRKPLLPGSEYLLPLLTRKPNLLIHSCTMMFRKAAFLQYDDPKLFSGRKWLCEDLQLFAAMANAGDIAYLPDITLHYSVDKPSVSSAEDPEKAYRFYNSSLRLTRELQLKYKIPDYQMKEYYSKIWRYVYSQACLCGNRQYIHEIMALRKELDIPIPLRTKIKIALTKLLGGRIAMRLAHKFNVTS